MSVSEGDGGAAVDGDDNKEAAPSSFPTLSALNIMSVSEGEGGAVVGGDDKKEAATSSFPTLTGVSTVRAIPGNTVGDKLLEV